MEELLPTTTKSGDRFFVIKLLGTTMTESICERECVSKVEKTGNHTSEKNASELVSVYDSHKDFKTDLCVGLDRITVIKKTDNSVILREERIVEVEISEDFPDHRLEEHGPLHKLYLYTNTSPGVVPIQVFAREIVDKVEKILEKKTQKKYIFDPVNAFYDLSTGDNIGGDYECSYEKVYRCTPSDIESLSSSVFSVNDYQCLELFSEWRATINLWIKDECDVDTDIDVYSDIEDGAECGGDNEDGDGDHVDAFEKQCVKRLPQITESPLAKRVKL